jgi:hypothetical protein
MSIQDDKFEIYCIGYKNSDYINKNYIKNILSEHNFNLCESIENADFILDTKEFSDTYDSVFSLEYAERDCIEVAETLYDLLRLRDEAEFRESQVR